MNGWDKFGKYVGVQGIMALALVGGFIFASVTGRTLSDFYGQLMTLVIGFYFAKNGVNVLQTLKDILNANTKTERKG